MGGTDISYKVENYDWALFQFNFLYGFLWPKTTFGFSRELFIFMGFLGLIDTTINKGVGPFYSERVRNPV